MILVHLAYHPPESQSSLKPLDFVGAVAPRTSDQGAVNMSQILQRIKDAPLDDAFVYLDRIDRKVRRQHAARRGSLLPRRRLEGRGRSGLVLDDGNRS